jgi:hypothetical protein
MKTLSLKSLSLLGLSTIMALSVSAQSQPKIKENANGETKYKSDDVKIKTNENEQKYKSDGVKVKSNDNEYKYKSDDLKVKTNENETKIKGQVAPMRRTATERTDVKTGETQVITKEHMEPINTQTTTTVEPAAVGVEQREIPKEATAVRKVAARKTTSRPKTSPTRRLAARKPSTAPRTIVRTKVIRDTVMVPSPPERVVVTNTEVVRDTVLVTRVDTVEKTQVVNTYNGYNVPRGDFKKVKLKKDKDGNVYMKRKE